VDPVHLQLGLFGFGYLVGGEVGYEGGETGGGAFVGELAGVYDLLVSSGRLLDDFRRVGFLVDILGQTLG